ncbi:MAG: ATP-binding protein [Clostridia bacterium]|nr:ATP-binding protein [Clostridia bacterium]
MNSLTSRLTLYSDLPEDSVLSRLAAVWSDFAAGAAQDHARSAVLTARVNREVKRLLDLGTTYGFDGNLWQNYLTFVMITHVNSFSLTCEQRGASDGTINAIAEADFEVFRQLFVFDFGPLEKALGLNCFSLLTHYRAIPKDAVMYNRNVSAHVRALSEAIAAAPDARTVFDLVTDHFRRFGTGLFGMNNAFRVLEGAGGGFSFIPINNLDAVTLDDLVGYDSQKAALRRNIRAFVAGRPFNNTLLYGDAGTGKSTSVKALVNEFSADGLRVIELNKHQFGLLAHVIAEIKTRRYRFIIFLDDLSFDEGEVEYKFLKAVIEGGLESRPVNVMILATSNRRHLVRETWRDRSDMEHEQDIHHSDTVEEKLSLAARFGCSIRYDSPDRALFNRMVLTLAHRRADIRLTDEELLAEANRYELRHGGVSGRTAQQFINQVAGNE